jgi:aspartokinase/homoserine dehydrogenase 1
MKQARLLVMGMGRVGRQFLTLLEAHRERLRHDLGLDLEIFALLRRGRVFWGDPLKKDRSLEELDWLPLASPRTALEAMLSENFQNLVLVDLTASETGALFSFALSRGVSVVTANKVPLAGPLAAFEALGKACRATGAQLRFECTVGAALPVLCTLRGLLRSGDRVTQVEGCLSGTLGYVMAGLGRGVPLSQVVREAYRGGFTEPDPRDDLGGMDVARKALILSRALGWGGELSQVEVRGLVPERLQGGDVETFLAGLDKSGDLPERVPSAGLVPRFMAQVEPGKITVGTELVSPDSLWGRLQGTDNLVAFWTERYGAAPLVIQGAGAGTVLTASGVLEDLLEVAR